MFVQVIQGRVSQASEVREQLDRWETDLAPGAVGWLGSTAGVTDDGQVIVLARFESEEAARRNSDRPEQGEWWAGVAELFTGEPAFHDSTSVDVETPGDPSQAGFVQVMQGRTSNPERVRELMTDDRVDWAALRPDILGTLSVNHEDGAWTMAVYFTSEAAAREGEQKEPPPEVQEMMQEVQALSIGEPTYYDLRDPWLSSPS